MPERRCLEIVFTALAGHAGCIATCFGVGFGALGASCAGAPPTGHPLAYLLSQTLLLLTAVTVGVVYFKWRSQGRRYLLVVASLMGLFVPITAPAATASLQAIFLVQLSCLVASRFRPACCTDN